MRSAKIERKTSETEIIVEINLDGCANYEVSTGVGFLDHMLEQLAKHSLIDINLQAKGDLYIDFHHTVEDSAIVLGQAIKKALGDKRGIRRYASADLPMDGTLARIALDISGRPFLHWKVNFSANKVGEMDTELFREWFYAFAMNSGITLHVEVPYGDNNHHIAESIFKALAHALRKAISIDERTKNIIPSTKGSL